MKIKKLIMNLVLNCLRPFLIFCKINPNKITFISLENDKLVGDFKRVASVLKQNPEYKLNFILVKFNKSLFGYLKYFFVYIRQFFAINTSKLVILDYNNFVVSNYKRKEVKVLQLWHASGAIKKFGNEVTRDYEIRNYDYIISNSDYFKKPYSKSFNVNEDKVISTGIPRTDRLFNKKVLKQYRKQMYHQFPILRNKKIILYAPTFRGRMGTKFHIPILDLDALAKNLGKDYVILYRLHPLLKKDLNFKNENIIDMQNVGLYKLFSITDFLISDYSAIMIDYCIFNKPLILYVPDLVEYKKEVGLNIDDKLIPGTKCYNTTQVYRAIKQNSYNSEANEKFKKLMFKYQDGKSLERVINLIDEIMNEETVK